MSGNRADFSSRRNLLMSLDDSFSLTGRVIVVTGGLGQLGRRFAESLLQAGARVALLDVVAPARPLSEIIEGGSDEALAFFHCDITERASIEAALAAIELRWDTPYGLINNAALDSPPSAPASENGPFENYPKASWDKVMEVNVTGTFLCCQVFGGAMAAAGRGSVINIGSIYGIVSPDQSLYEYRRRRGEDFYKPIAYAVSKSALVNMTRYLAVYWARKNVRVNLLTFAGVFNHQDDEFLAEYNRRIPVGRMADASDYQGACIFLLADASRYMTGSNVVIDGGWTAW